MANEFIIKNGFRSKGDSQINGSLGITGSLIFKGNSEIYYQPSGESIFYLTLPITDGSSNTNKSGSILLLVPGYDTPTNVPNYHNEKFRIATRVNSPIGQVTFSGSQVVFQYPTASFIGLPEGNEGYPHSTLNLITYDSASGQFYFTGSGAIGSTPTLQQVTTAGNSTTNVIQAQGGIDFSNGSDISINQNPATSVLSINTAEEDTTVEIKGFGNNTNAKFGDSNVGIQLTGSTAGVKIKGSITGDTSLNITGTGGISSSAGLLLNDTATGATARANSVNIIQAPKTSPSSGTPGAPVIIKGGNSGGSGAKGGDLYLEGGIPTAGIGGNIYIAGGNGSTSGSVYLDGNGIFANPSLNTNTLKNYAGTQVLVSQSATTGATEIHGNNSGGTQIFESGESLFQIYRAGSPYVATISASNNQYESRVIATYGRFSEIEGGSPLVINTGTSTLKISASNFNVSTAGEMSSGGSDGISTTSITASSDISLPTNISSINFIGEAGARGRTDGSYPGLTLASGTGTSNRIWFGKSFTDTSAITASFLNIGAITNVNEIIPHPNYPLILKGGPNSNGNNDGVRIDTAGTTNGVFFNRFEIESDSDTVDAYFQNINGLGINKTSGFAAELDVNGDINASGDITGSKFKGDGSNLTGVGTLTGNGTSTRVPFYNGTTSFTNSAGFVYVDGSKQLQLTGDSSNAPLRISNLQEGTAQVALIVDAENNDDIQKRTLGSNAFTSTTIPTNNNQLTNGAGYVTGAFPFTGSGGISGSLEIIGSGSGLFSVEGSVGTLFTVNDGLDDVIFAANNVSGTPVISANADNTVKLGKLGGFGIVISGSTPAPNDSQAKIIITGSIHTSGSLGVGMAASSTIGRIDAKNDVVAFSTSDKRLKDNITPIENALNKVSQVQGIEFDWVEKEGIHGNEGHDVGVIAQEIEKVLPEVVTTRDNGYKAVKYEKIIPLLIEAIKELQAEVQELKNSK